MCAMWHIVNVSIALIKSISMWIIIYKYSYHTKPLIVLVTLTNMANPCNYSIQQKNCNSVSIVWVWTNCSLRFSLKFSERIEDVALNLERCQGHFVSFGCLVKHALIIFIQLFENNFFDAIS